MRKAVLADIARFVIDQTSTVVFSGGSAPLRLEHFFVEPSLVRRTGEIVRPSDALEESRAIMIVGPPGAGKTTLLQHLAKSQAVDFLGGKVARCPVFLPARTLRLINNATELPTVIAGALMLKGEQPGVESLVREACVKGLLSIYVDGFDEVTAHEERARLSKTIQHAFESYRELRLIVSSRPAAIAGWPDGYAFFQIQAFTDETVVKYIRGLSQLSPESSDQFLKIIGESRYLGELARNPLFLTLLWQIYIAKRRLPTSQAFLYADVTDFLLSTWDRSRGINRTGALRIEEVQLLLENIARFQFDNQRHSLTKQEAMGLIAQTLNSASGSLAPNPADILEQLLFRSGILREIEREYVSFVHLSFLEFYAAKALLSTPRLLVSAIDKPSGHQVVLFASGMVQDVGPIVEAAVEKGLILLAATCISNGRLENRQLANYVVQELRREVGESFFNLLLAGQTGSEQAPNPHADLLSLWTSANEEGLLAHEKGKRLETFAKRFFGQFFRVVRGNLNTEAGEIDILLENVNPSPFWLEFGADVLVECKNWISHVPIHEIGHFGFKASQFRVRLAFFIALSGFTEDALRAIRNQAAASTGPLMIPIRREDIERTLMSKEVLEEFLKDRIREIKYLQKY